ncbi:MAG TPA: GDSL-type esterase/lipase family protein [Candidatus Methylomirabilis sp.]|nr:GDSL-type esterase/lipase family protein [Candidatus Methylomirabilis sp.]
MTAWKPGGHPIPAKRSQVARQPISYGRRWRPIAALLCLLVVAGGWYLTRDRGPDLQQVANLDAPGDLVVFFGDSITQGYGVREGDSFASLAARELGVAFVNAGVSGDTMSAGLARMDRDVLPHRPRLTVVEFGGNDFLRRVPVEETLQNLDAIVSRMIAQGGMVVILEVNVGLMGDPYLKGYRAIAGRHGAVLVEDIMRGILGSPDLKLDGIHPNAQGHRLIAERVIRVLRPLLREADRRRGSQGKTASDFPLPEIRPVG